MTRPLSWCVALLALVSVTMLSNCSEDKEQASRKARVAASASGDCSVCERDNEQLSSKLKATQNQVRKLKKQLKAKARRKKRR